MTHTFLVLAFSAFTAATAVVLLPLQRRTRVDRLRPRCMAHSSRVPAHVMTDKPLDFQIIGRDLSAESLAVLQRAALQANTDLAETTNRLTEVMRDLNPDEPKD